MALVGATTNDSDLSVAEELAVVDNGPEIIVGHHHFDIVAGDF